MGDAIGLIEAIGFATAIAAVDAATKAANVTCLGYEKVIGVDKAISITAKLSGDVAAVQAAVQAGKIAGEKVGKVVSTHVIPRPHAETRKIIETRETLASVIWSSKQQQKIPVEVAEETSVEEMGNKEDKKYKRNPNKKN